MAESKVKRDMRSLGVGGEEGPERVKGGAYLEINCVAGPHAFFGQSNGILCVSVEELEVADLVASEDRSGHGAVEPGWMSEGMWGLQSPDVLPHVAWAWSLVASGRVRRVGSYHRN